MCDFIGQRTHLRQPAQCHLLSLRWLFQLSWVWLGKAELLLEDTRWKELSDPDFADRAVTNKSPEAEHICDHCLVVRLPEHERHEFTHRVQDHNHMGGGLRLVGEATVVRIDQRLGNIVRDLRLRDQPSWCQLGQ